MYVCRCVCIHACKPWYLYMAVRVDGTVHAASGNKYTISCVSADCRKLHRHIWFSDKTEPLKTPTAILFDDDGNTLPADAPSTVIILPIRDTTMTIHCKKKLAVGKSYVFHITYRWYTSDRKHVCLLIASI